MRAASPPFFFVIPYNLPMRIAIVGAGASGLFLARALAHKGMDIVLFEHKDSAGKKLMATGNGRCNILNKGLSPYAYNNPSFVAPLIEEFPYSRLHEVIEKDWGVPLYEIGEYVYPASLSAIAFGNYLRGALDADIHLNSRVGGYRADEDGVTLFHDGIRERFDEVVFATGGMSAPKFGSDGSLAKVFAEHGYKISELRPGLTPVLVEEIEGLKSISGVRIKALVRLIDQGHEITSEEGEVLFRKDGLSGIVIFNMSSSIARRNLSKPVLEIFPLPSVKGDRAAMLSRWKETSPGHYLESIFVPSFASYLLERSRRTGVPLENLIASIPFHWAGNGGFDESTVTIGGIKTSEISSDFHSIRENRVSFIGELLDIDGICGGFNLSFALMSALKLAQSLLDGIR